MNYRIMKKDEFVARMLADQELCRERRRGREMEYIQYCKDRRTKIEHKKYLKEKSR